MNFRKGYHHSQELENAVIGALLLECDAISRVHGLVEAEYFYFPDNKLLFETISEMWSDGMKIDMISVLHMLHAKEDAQEVFKNGMAFDITKKTEAVASTAHLEQHAVFIRQMAARRKRIEIQSMADDQSGDDVSQIQDLIESLNKIMTVNATDDWHDMSEVMLSVMRHMDEVRGKDMLGIHTGFRELDQWTMGWQPGQLIVIAARPSVGKSAFVSKMALTAAKENKTVGIINLEMPEEQVGARLLSFYSDKEFWRIYTANLGSDGEEQRLMDTMGELSQYNIYISDKTNVTVPDIRSKALKLKKRAGLNMLVIDYLQLIEGDGNKKDTREREVAKMSRGLKLLAKELGIPVVILCQLNRDTAKSPDKKPRMSNIRESGAIEQDADVVMLIHSDWKAGIEQDGNGESTEGKRTIIVDKCRNGRTGEITTGFNPETMKFFDEQEPDLIPLSETGYTDYTEPNSAEVDDTPF